MKKLTVAAILLLISIAPAFKGLYFESDFTLFFALIALMAAVYFVAKLKNKEMLMVNKPILILNLLLIVAYSISLLNAEYPDGAFGAIKQYTVYLLVFLVVYDYFAYESAKSLHIAFMTLFTLVGFALSIFALVCYAGALDWVEGITWCDRLALPLQYTNTSAAYFLICILFALTLVNYLKNSIVKSFFSAVACVLFIALFFTGSRGIFLLTPFVYIVYLFCIDKKDRLNSLLQVIMFTVAACISFNGYGQNAYNQSYIWAMMWVVISFAAAFLASIVFCYASSLKNGRGISRIVLLTLAAIVLITGIVLYNSAGGSINGLIPERIRERIETIGFSAESVITRFENYKDAIKIIKSRYLFGAGGEGWASLYYGVQDKYYISRAVHNHYLEVFVEAGILAFISFTTMVLFALYYYIAAIIREKDSKIKLCISAYFCSFLLIAAHSMIDFDLTYKWFALLFWILIAVSAAYYKRGEVNGIKVKINSRIALLLILILSTSLIFVNAADFKASYYAKRGEDLRKAGNTAEAIKNYELASAKDKKNAEYCAVLAQMYYSMYQADTTKTTWQDKALLAAENAVKLNPKQPDYNSLLTDYYYRTKNYVKAYAQVEKLIKLQPKKVENYDMLAKVYMSTGLYYASAKEYKKANELINKVVKIDKMVSAEPTNRINFYKGKALLLLKQYSEAEKYITMAKADVTLKIDCDRLLYIVYERTGRQAELEKYRDVLWMAFIEKNLDYIEVNSIIDGNILEKAVE